MDAAFDGTGFFRAASFGSPPRFCASTTVVASATANTREKRAATQRIVVTVLYDRAPKSPGSDGSVLQVQSPSEPDKEFTNSSETAARRLT